MIATGISSIVQKFEAAKYHWSETRKKVFLVVSKDEGEGEGCTGSETVSCACSEDLYGI